MNTLDQRQREFRRAQIGTAPTSWPALPREAIQVLESLLVSGAPVRIWYGDKATGEAWPDEYHVAGTISRTGGKIKAGMLVPHGAQGGSPLMDCLIAIMTGPGRFAWKHPSFDPGTWTVERNEDPGTCAFYPFETRHNGQIHGRHKTELSAQRLAAFMRGERMRK
jgi:hypothetical protein